MGDHLKTRNIKQMLRIGEGEWETSSAITIIFYKFLVALVVTELFTYFYALKIKLYHFFIFLLI